MISRLPLVHAALLLSSLGVAAIASTACGGISDPTKGGEGRVAPVTAALTGISVPANARVALVYRKVTTDAAGTHGSVEVGSDVAVIGGKFTMNLGIPADDYFSSTDASASSGVSASPPSSEVLPAPAPTTGMAGSSTSGSPGAFGASQLTPRDIVGGSITEPLSAAIAGFVVYADTNGNGKLDLEGDYASSPDQILGGNKELTLVYLKGGGSLDYEKMRDKSGILPTAGFDLAWSEGRWLPLSDVELKLNASARLPSAVCERWISVDGSGSGSVSSDPSGTSGGSGPVATVDGGSTGSSGGSSGGFPANYPSPSDPNLHCSPDGRSYTYGGGSSSCPPSPPQPTGLCAGDIYTTVGCAGSDGYGNALSSGAPVPDGWPCPVSGSSDGGAADASVDGGSFDGGSADGGSADGG
jgi:hypothetical protein